MWVDLLYYLGYEWVEQEVGEVVEGYLQVIVMVFVGVIVIIVVEIVGIVFFYFQRKESTNPIAKDGFGSIGVPIATNS